MNTSYQAAGFVRPSYEEFEPQFEWNSDATSQILVLDLPGFKKEYLKVQFDNHGNVKISGARPLQPLDASKWSRFSKDFRVPSTCDAGSIRAKFENGSLSVFMPRLAGKKINEEKDNDDDKQNSRNEKENEKEREKEKEKDRSYNESKDEREEELKEKKDADGRSEKMEFRKNRVSRMMVGKAVVGMVLVLGVGFFFTQWFLKKHHPYFGYEQVETYYGN